MGLFGGGNSSSSTTYLTENVDRRIALDNQSAGISGDSNTLTVNTTATDHGAVLAAVGASESAVAGANKSVVEALKMANASTGAALAAAQESVAAASAMNRESLSFASTVNRDSLALAERGQTLIANSAAESLGMVGHVVDLAFRSNDKNVLQTMEAVANSNNLVGRAYETATAYQAEKQTADSKYLVVAGLIAVALVAVKAFAR